MIPKIIHQYWDGDLPTEYQFFSEQLQILNPQYKYYLWNKQSLLLEFQNHPLHKFLEASSHPLVSSDIARIIFLDVFGGLYLDSDIEPIIPFPDHILIHDCFACYEHEYSFGQTIANGVIGSKIKSIFIQQLIKEISYFDIDKVKQVTTQQSWLIFGPRLWTKVFFDLYCRNIMVYPSWYFMANHYNENKNLPKINGYITNHHWKDYSSWPNIIQYTHNCPYKIISEFYEINNMRSQC